MLCKVHCSFCFVFIFLQKLEYVYRESPRLSIEQLLQSIEGSGDTQVCTVLINVALLPEPEKRGLTVYLRHSVHIQKDHILEKKNNIPRTKDEVI